MSVTPIVLRTYAGRVCRLYGPDDQSHCLRRGIDRFFCTTEALDAALDPICYEREALPWEAVFLAGKCYLSPAGWPADRPLPEFYIGAHAAVERLALLRRATVRAIGPISEAGNLGTRRASWCRRERASRVLPSCQSIPVATASGPVPHPARGPVRHSSTTHR
jgi:hypothetical protein